MTYIEMNEALAIRLGIIQEQHHFKNSKGSVVFKKDLLTIWQQQNNQESLEYKEISTAEALKITERWN